ncbi:hypothetical protein KAI46_00005 [bacterium]|nr:hypothetical protein [bacterium]
MIIKLKTGILEMFLFVTVTLLLSACVTPEVKPPPKTGEIIARFSHGAEALDFDYSVGVLDGQLKIVGVIENTYLSDLDNFKLDLSVAAADDRVVFKDSTTYFDIEEHASHTFVFHMPFLHGPHRLTFRYEYIYYDFAESGRRGRVSMRSDSSEWSYVEDLIDLP